MNPLNYRNFVSGIFYYWDYASRHFNQDGISNVGICVFQVTKLNHAIETYSVGFDL